MKPLRCNIPVKYSVVLNQIAYLTFNGDFDCVFFYICLTFIKLNYD